MNDRISDLSRRSGPHRNRGVGRTGMSAEVIRFIVPPPRNARTPTDFPTIAFRSIVEPNELPADYADTAPCELVPFACDET